MIKFAIIKRAGCCLPLFFLLKAGGGICYDVTTDHTCKESTANQSYASNEETISTEGSQKSYLVQSSVLSVQARLDCGSTASTAGSTGQNLVDIHEFIEQSSLDEQERFVCRWEAKIRALNQSILRERAFMEKYIADKKAGRDISQEDRIEMTALMIKYRLLQDKNDICKPYRTGDGVCFFSPARFDVPSEAFRNMTVAAKKYVNQYEEPAGCLIGGRELPFTDDRCEKEILSRVQVIPAPLIITQAVQESGWGSSRWANEYTNYLGLQVKFTNPPTMPCYKNCRCAGEVNERCGLTFTNIDGCLYAYSMRFNAAPHKEYSDFRKTRSSQQNIEQLDNVQAQCANARSLLPHLAKYAEDTNYEEHICKRLNQSVCNKLQKCPKYDLVFRSSP